MYCVIRSASSKESFLVYSWRQWGDPWSTVWLGNDAVSYR